jgi:hypothetical protein
MRGALIKESLQKLEEVRAETEETKQAPKEVQSLCIYTKRVDKNSIFALQAALPSSQIHTLKYFSNNFS